MRTNLHGAGGSVVLAMIYPKWHRLAVLEMRKTPIGGFLKQTWGMWPHVMACDDLIDLVWFVDESEVTTQHMGWWSPHPIPKSFDCTVARVSVEQGHFPLSQNPGGCWSGSEWGGWSWGWTRVSGQRESWPGHTWPVDWWTSRCAPSILCRGAMIDTPFWDPQFLAYYLNSKWKWHAVWVVFAWSSLQVRQRPILTNSMMTMQCHNWVTTWPLLCSSEVPLGMFHPSMSHPTFQRTRKVRDLTKPKGKCATGIATWPNSWWSSGEAYVIFTLGAFEMLHWHKVPMSQ